MKFSVGVEYSMHSLVYMVDYYEQKSISIVDLARFNNISESYLSKIFGKLSKAQIIKSVPGVKGGYMLNKKPEDISFWEVIVAIEGNDSFFNCKEIRKTSSLSCDTNKTDNDFKTPCLIHAVMREAELEMQKYLEAKSLLWLKQTVYTDTFNDNDKKYISDFFNQI